MITSKISFGNRVPNSGPLASPQAIVAVAKASEALGFDEVWVHDQLTWTEEIHKTHISSGAEEALTSNHKPDFFEAMTTMAYLAAVVQKVRLGIACLVLPCRNPIYAAKQVASLDVMSGGRIDLGIGIGSPATLHAREYEMFGVDRRRRGTYEREMSLDFLREVSLIGAPAEVLARVKSYAKAGVSHFETKFIYPSIERALDLMRLFAVEVIEPARG